MKLTQTMKEHPVVCIPALENQREGSRRQMLQKSGKHRFVQKRKKQQVGNVTLRVCTD